MSKFDFNKEADFAIATMSASTALLSAFARDQTTWSISEGSYRGGRKNSQAVLFHVFKSKTPYQAGLSRIADQGGRRFARLPFPYVDGQTTDDLGRRGEDFDVEIVLHGTNYKQAMNRLMREFNDPIPGTLEHPVNGTLRAKAIDWSRVHEASTKQAVMITVKFTEHNFDTAAFGNVLFGVTTKSALQAAIAALQKIGAVIAAIRQIVGLIQGAILAIRQKLQELYSMFQNLLVDSASSFGLSDNDLAAILPINQGGVVAPVAGGRTAGGVNPNADPGQFGANATTTSTSGVGGTSITTGGFVRVSTRFTTVVAPSDPFANLPIDLLGDVARQAIEQTQLTRRADVMRQMANEINADIDAAIEDTKQASLISAGRASAAVVTLTDSKISILESCSSMAQVLKSGSGSGRPAIINYTVPRAMSIREAAFLNGLTAQDGADISLLNAFLESTNQIEKDTVLRIPVFV